MGTDGGALGSIRIDAPDGLLASVLVERLAAFSPHVIGPAGMGRIQVVVSLRGQPASAVPAILTSTRRWLVDVRLARTKVEIDGHAHLLRALG